MMSPKEAFAVLRTINLGDAEGMTHREDLHELYGLDTEAVIALLAFLRFKDPYRAAFAFGSIRRLRDLLIVASIHHRELSKSGIGDAECIDRLDDLVERNAPTRCPVHSLWPSLEHGCFMCESDACSPPLLKDHPE